MTTPESRIHECGDCAEAVPDLTTHRCATTVRRRVCGECGEADCTSTRRTCLVPGCEQPALHAYLVVNDGKVAHLSDPWSPTTTGGPMIDPPHRDPASYTLAECRDILRESLGLELTLSVSACETGERAKAGPLRHVLDLLEAAE